jgi:DNA repair protein RecO (recombination protein O)
MRPKYDTQAIVLSRSPFGDTSATVTLITPDLGLVRALAQGVRTEGAKLAPALTTFTESSIHLVRGRRGWQVTGAVLEERWIMRLSTLPARIAAARFSGLITRMVGDDVREPHLFAMTRSFFEALTTLPEDTYEPAELLAALRVLSVLGLDAGALPGTPTDFSPRVITEVATRRADYAMRVNRGISASGL